MAVFILHQGGNSRMGKKRRKLQGTVQKIIKPLSPNQPEKAQIEVVEVDDLYRELRSRNEVADEEGGKTKLKPEAEVPIKGNGPLYHRSQFRSLLAII
jgi:hypothetical protein